MDFTGALMSRTGGLSAAAERPLPIIAQTCTASFGIDLQAAQLIGVPGGLGMSSPDVPLNDPRTADNSENPSLADLMMWLGVTLPLPIELRPDNTAAGTEDDSVQLVPNNSPPMTCAELTNEIEVALAPPGELREELVADPRSVSIDPVTVAMPTLDPGLRFTPETKGPAIFLPSSTIDERLLTDLSLDDVRLPLGDQTPTHPTVDEAPKTFDVSASDAENTVTIDPPTGFVSVQPNEAHRNIPHPATQSSHSSSDIPVEPRTELSEVVRHVRTMVTEHETRSTIQLEPVELGRLTLELVDAPEGLRAYVSAEDRAVLRFLERNVQLLETEARLHGVGQLSFSVGANVSGGLGGGDQRQSEAEASFRKNIEWNTAPQAKPRSRRELDTSA